MEICKAASHFLNINLWHICNETLYLVMILSSNIDVLWQRNIKQKDQFFLLHIILPYNTKRNLEHFCLSAMPITSVCCLYDLTSTSAIYLWHQFSKSLKNLISKRVLLSNILCKGNSVTLFQSWYNSLKSMPLHRRQLKYVLTIAYLVYC